MSDHIHQTIAQLQAKLRQQEEAVTKTKRTINMLCEEADLPLIYAEAEADTSGSLFSMRSDQFYGRPLATVIKEYLRMRRNANMGAATVNEIYDALQRGGYKFGGKNDDNSKRGLQVSLSKNTDFHRIPSGAWGLTEWYPNVKPEKADRDDSSETSETDKGDDAKSEGKSEASVVVEPTLKPTKEKGGKAA